jgi:hypothetical protein
MDASFPVLIDDFPKLVQPRIFIPAHHAGQGIAGCSPGQISKKIKNATPFR